MPVPNSVRKWFGWPGRLALLLGLGAISTAGAEAGPAAMPPDPGATRVPQQSVADFGELRVWRDNGRLYLSERNGPPTELRLGDSAEARDLRRLLENRGATAADPEVLRHRIILVGGGGAGGTPDPSASSQPSGSGGDDDNKAAAAQSKRTADDAKSGAMTQRDGRRR